MSEHLEAWREIAFRESGSEVLSMTRPVLRALFETMDERAVRAEQDADQLAEAVRRVLADGMGVLDEPDFKMYGELAAASDALRDRGVRHPRIRRARLVAALERRRGDGSPVEPASPPRDRSRLVPVVTMSPAELERLRTCPKLAGAREAGVREAERAVAQGFPATITIGVAA